MGWAETWMHLRLQHTSIHGLIYVLEIDAQTHVMERFQERNYDHKFIHIIINEQKWY